MRWTYGITTVPSRRQTLFPRTLASLRKGGFDAPRIFLDGATHTLASDYEREFQLPVTARVGEKNLRVTGNWVVGMWELYARNPEADRFAMFQDDFVTYRNLKKYLERAKYPDRGYCNLYSFPSQEALAPKAAGWYESTQHGKGAVALVFSREAVMRTLSAWHLIDHVNDVHRGHHALDGAIVDSLKKVGWLEYVHAPSLVQHTGDESTIGHHAQLKSEMFQGELFDAMDLLGGTYVRSTGTWRGTTS